MCKVVAKRRGGQGTAFNIKGEPQNVNGQENTKGEMKRSEREGKKKTPRRLKRAVKQAGKCPS